VSKVKKEKEQNSASHSPMNSLMLQCLSIMIESFRGKPENRKQNSLLYGSVIFDARENTPIRIEKLSEPTIAPQKLTTAPWDTQKVSPTFWVKIIK